MKGVVKFFNRTRGWGFIRAEDGREVFVHYSQIMGDGYRSLRRGEHVVFEVAESADGPKAKRCLSQGRIERKP